MIAVRCGADVLRGASRADFRSTSARFPVIVARDAKENDTL
jgi:hypothetical protein